MDRLNIAFLLLLFTVVTDTCLGDEIPSEFWNQPCGRKEVRVVNQNTCNMTQLVDQFLHDDRQLYGLRDHLKLFNDTYTHVNNTRIHLKKRQLLNRNYKRLPNFLPDHEPTSQTGQVMVNMYKDLSYMSVFLTEAYRNEERYEKGLYGQNIRHFLKKLQKVQCRLAQMIWTDGRFEVPVVSSSVLGRYKDIPWTQSRYYFLFMVTRDSLNRLVNISRNFDASSWNAEEENFRPTPQQYQESTFSAPVPNYASSSDSPQNVPAYIKNILVGLGLTVCALIVLLCFVCWCKCFRRGSLVSPIDEEAHF